MKLIKLLLFGGKGLENRISFLRRTKGIKQYDLARVLEVSPSFLCKIEKGLQEPTDIFKNKCADYFNERVESIFSLVDERKGNNHVTGESTHNNLWIVRIKKNLKQNKLAELLGCSPSYLSKIEKGLQSPNVTFRKKCAKILRIKEIELFPANESIQ